MTHTNPETIARPAGWRADPTTGSVAVPIHIIADLDQALAAAG